MKLTLSAARAMVPGDVLNDAVVTGLTLRMRVEAKTWSLWYRTASGNAKRFTLGKYPDISIEDARDIARKAKVNIAAGIDPAKDKADAKGALRVAQLCQMYIDDADTSAGMKGRSWIEKRRHIEKYVMPLMGKLLVADTTTADVNRMLAAIAKKGINGRPSPIAANRVRDSASSLFAYAERDDIGLRPRNSNPARGDAVKRYAEHLRSRHASPEELMRLAEHLDALETEYPNRVMAIRCIMFTGSRVTELIEARREWIIGNALVLAKHKTDRHGGPPRVIVLPPQALAEIANVVDDGSGYLFGANLTVHNIDTVFNKARQAAGAPTLQLRDMRRTFASAGSSSGSSLTQIGDILGHTNPSTTNRYAWLFDAEKTKLVGAIATEMETRMKGRGG